MKYFFITYQATNKDGSISKWNQVIDCSPMDFIKKIEIAEMAGSKNYYNFVVINTCEISKIEFDKFDGFF